MSRARILLVDDEPGVLYMLREVLSERGHDVIAVSSGAAALAHIDGASLVVSDLAMPGMDGLALLAHVHERRPELPFVLITAHGNERVAVSAMKAGAYDYLTKPVDIDELRLVVDRALESSQLRTEVRLMKAERALGRRLIAESVVMRRLLESIERIADKDLTVLVRGETGSGKELVASLVHAQSRRESGPLVRFNCAALPAELAEAELFGHARGAFTGAVATRRGFFAEADRGTLVLDEIGELPMTLQPKLLRALQDGEIQPIGGRIEKVDVRVVASTHRDLAAEVKAGRFREDLYYRLAVVELVVPALRERRDEIPALARGFAERYGERFGMPDVSLSPELIDALCRGDWPGNVRQLENTIARMVALSGPRVGLDAFLSPSAPAPEPDAEPPVEGERDAAPLPLRAQVEAFERGLVVRALADCKGNQSHAARRLGIGRATLIDKMKRYGIK
ncbi:sigma-54-dependent transcriptional regulator [Sandaracinus amylolyticus]|uniref:Response regulator of zinc sigma-54-dependent two-component system n=1 Tax=Sandaracinus amylolyticus TaxID=927083 RepID=A0A0F6SGU7_9BACT|nr:sigma-54 dependent transcriptional regulator [Sandaracinus amylolyticus]AKF09314.1 Response regulator of zinc sigma-54-dependent two-component system [Sandaracinus amylolyticus]